MIHGSFIRTVPIYFVSFFSVYYYQLNQECRIRIRISQLLPQRILHRMMMLNKELVGYFRVETEETVQELLHLMTNCLVSSVELILPPDSLNSSTELLISSLILVSPPEICIFLDLCVGVIESRVSMPFTRIDGSLLRKRANYLTTPTFSARPMI